MVSGSRAAFYSHAALVQVLTFVLRPTATYRAVELEVATHWLGVLAAGFAIMPLLLAVVVGRAADRYGERAVMLAGSVLVVAGALGFVVLGAYVPGLVLASSLLGLGHLCSVVGQQALVANGTESHRYDTAFGHYTFATSLGQSIGPLLILLVGGPGTLPDTGAIFAWSTGLAAALLVLTVSMPVTGTRPRSAWSSDAGVRALLRTPGLVRAVSVSSVVLAAVDTTLVYLPALGAERGIAAGTVGALLTVRAAASMSSRLALGRLAARIGRPRLLTGSLALSSVALALVAAPMPTWLLFAVVAFAGFGLGVGQPMTMSWLAEATPVGMRATAMSLRLTGNRLGQVVVPSAAGLVAAGAGAGGVLILTAATLAVVGATARGLR